MKLHLRFLRCTVLGVLAILSLAGVASAAMGSKPNIIYILADDLGWGSIGCYGADTNLVRTPNIDRLAREGRRFTDANVSASICSPSRYSILTGRYCWRTSLKYEVLGDTSPLHIETNRLTVASLLKAQGYNTAAIGKWHLGFGTNKPCDYLKSLRPGPQDIGFDYYYGLAANHSDKTGVYLDTERDEQGLITRIEGLRSTNTAAFGTNHYGGKYIGFDAPQRVDEEVMPRFTEKAIAWIDQQKKGRPFFIYFAPVAVHGPETPSAATKGTSRAGIYGDWIHELDRSVGRFLDALDQRGLAKDTLVIFTSDNGGENRNFEKNAVAAIKLGLKMNGDWRNGKHSVFEGGLRVPFIARWPGHVPANTVSDEPICLVDTLATFAALTGAKLPPAPQGAEDSFNVLPAILGEETSALLRPALIGHSGWGVFSVRQGPWKWIEGKYAPTKQPNSEKNEFHPQLYNLTEDPQETRDVIAEHPEVASKLSALLDAYRQQGHSRE